MAVEQIKKIIKVRPDIINRDVIDRISVLSYSVLQDSPPDLIEFLIEKGADVNKCEDAGTGTPLIWSLIRNIGESPDFKKARLLIKNGADINYTGGNCPTALVAVIKNAVGAKDRSYHPNQVDMKKKILDFLFTARDSEGRRLEFDCQINTFINAKDYNGEDFEAYLKKKCNRQAARNIAAAKEVWMGNKGYTSKRSGFGEIPINVLYGHIFPLLGGPEGPRKSDGTRAHVNPAFVGSMLRSGVKIPKGLETPYSQLYEWAENVRLGTGKARATDEAARSLVRLSQWPYNVRPSQGRYYERRNGKTVRSLAQTNV